MDKKKMIIAGALVLVVAVVAVLIGRRKAAAATVASPAPSPTGTGSGNRPTRNNNPLNIRKSSDKFVGETGDDGAFKIFDSPANGIRAVFRILQTYERQYHAVTLREKLTKWAPPTENRATYPDEVAKMAGVNADEPAHYYSLTYWLKVMPHWARLEGFANLSQEDIRKGFETANLMLNVF